ncbi:MAG TPA: hypothetical protein VK817_06085 [Trebonia sp.]|nr:hypothetical protein [Trebonia sp.]
MTPPAEIAANSAPATVPPAAGPPNRWCASCGNSAAGSPKNSVTKSTAYATSRISCRTR